MGIEYYFENDRKEAYFLDILTHNAGALNDIIEQLNILQGKQARPIDKEDFQKRVGSATVYVDILREGVKIAELTCADPKKLNNRNHE